MDGSVLANRSGIDRIKTDYYPTPADVTLALISFLGLLPNTIIWESACGEGHMAEVLKKFGYGVIASDLFDRGYGETGIDFLTAPLPECEWIITNPPFTLSDHFIKRCIDHALPFAMLLKSQYWHSQKRRSLFERHKPKAVLPLTWRPDFLFGQKSGNPTIECLWTVWGDRPATITEYIPLLRPRRDPLNLFEAVNK